MFILTFSTKMKCFDIPKSICFVSSHVSIELHLSKVPVNVVPSFFLIGWVSGLTTGPMFHCSLVTHPALLG